jgi:hypothetical protein
MDEEYRLMRRAIKEAMLYLEAPSDSPRHWPVSRANLYQLLKRAYIVSQSRAKPRTEDDIDT